MEQLINISDYRVKPVLKLLLSDKSTKQNIVFATSSYAHLGNRYAENCHIDADLLYGMDAMEIQPRVLKDAADQADRTKKKAEVMTLAWIVNKMNNHCDEEWFGYPDVFNLETETSWAVCEDKISFPEGKTWQKYVDSMRLEITCGEAPYLVSRYDTTTGESIPVSERMAYGDDTVTLATFDTKVPGKVFYDVTSITVDEFKALRDGEWTDPDTGEVKKYSSGLFDEVVFDDSIKEFMNLKRKLADYFDEKSVEDLFDYIPPQKTFQIFTPKLMVQKMVDQLEEENHGCFDDPNHTFIDLYMKSGLYPAEIVKRLYRSPKMKEIFPDGHKRLEHIFEKQVFGLAPTEIIYNIAISYILGFDEDLGSIKHNFRLADALPYAKEGKLQELLETLYGYEED